MHLLAQTHPVVPDEQATCRPWGDPCEPCRGDLPADALDDLCLLCCNLAQHVHDPGAQLLCRLMSLLCVPILVLLQVHTAARRG